MDWDDLHYVLAVARAGRISDAARALGVAHTTVYRRIAALEASAGVRFFHRDEGGAYALTEAGQELKELGVEFERRMTAFERGLTTRDKRLDGIVTLATTELIAIELSEQLRVFRRTYPGIRIQLAVGNGMADLEHREADIALRATQAPGESLVGRKVAMVAFAVYASTAYCREGPVDLTRAEWVCFDASLEATGQGRWEAEHVPPDRVCFRTNSSIAFLEAVSSGAGVGVLPCAVAARSRSLVALTGILPELTLPLWLLTHRDFVHVPRVRVLLEFLGEAMQTARPLLEGAGSSANGSGVVHER